MYFLMKQPPKEAEPDYCEEGDREFAKHEHDYSGWVGKMQSQNLPDS
jgi:hypothetical protein